MAVAIISNFEGKGIPVLPSLYETLQCVLLQVMACCVFLIQELIQKAIDCALEAKKSWERMSFEARYMCTWGWGCMRGGRIRGGC